MESVTGSIEVGKAADFVLLDRNIVAAEADDIEAMLSEFEYQVEELFNLGPENFDMSVDDNADPVLDASGNATWNPSGDNNGIAFTSNDASLADAVITLVGSHEVSGGGAGHVGCGRGDADHFL